jgi:hypothetical protein
VAVTGDHRWTKLLKEKQVVRKISLADIALTIARPSALTIEGFFVAVRKTPDLKLANGWKGSCVCGFNEEGDLSALWLGETIEDDLLDCFPDYGFSIGHIGNICAFRAWAGRWNQAAGGDIRDGVFVPVHEEAPRYWDDVREEFVPVSEAPAGLCN